MRVLLVAGGPSPESSVSRASAAEVSAALRVMGHESTVCELGPELPKLLSSCEVVFPLAHGALGEDGCLQGLLELFALPYVGADVRASAVAAHKPTAKTLFRAAGLPVARERVAKRTEHCLDSDLEAEAEIILRELGAQLVIKPAAGGSAVGVERVFDASIASIAAALRRVMAGDDALIECFHQGLEVTCGVLEDPQPRPLPPTLIHPQSADWYDFRSRYQAGGSRHECPAPLPATTFRKVQEYALAAHLAVGARDLSRVDFVVSGDQAIVLEVNTLPGMTGTSLFPEAAAALGISFPQLCDRLVRRAFERPKHSRFAAPEYPV